MSHTTYFPARGDVIHFNASPSVGRETAGPHFALVMSPLSYNKKSGVAIVLIGSSKMKPESHPRFSNVLPIPPGVIAPTKNNPSGEGVFFCDNVRQIDWRERFASFAGKMPKELVEDALDRLLAAMEDDQD